jgi:hypothetical protein
MINQILRQKWIDKLKAIQQEAEDDKALSVASVLAGLIASLYMQSEDDLARHQCEFSKLMIAEITRLQSSGTGAIQ